MARNEPNPWVGVNYFDIDSKMAVPPAFWLQRLYDFDADLVVFPSSTTPYAYVLARRARKTGGLNQRDPFYNNAPPDTKFCVARHLLPVTMIYRFSQASWSIDNILEELRSRDTWAAGGAEAFVDKADAFDESERQKIHQGIRDDFYNRSGDGWRSYQARTGQRTKTHYGHRQVKQAT